MVTVTDDAGSGTLRGTRGERRTSHPGGRSSQLISLSADTSFCRIHKHNAAIHNTDAIQYTHSAAQKKKNNKKRGQFFEAFARLPTLECSRLHVHAKMAFKDLIIRKAFANPLARSRSLIGKTVVSTHGVFADLQTRSQTVQEIGLGREMEFPRWSSAGSKSA